MATTEFDTLNSFGGNEQAVSDRSATPTSNNGNATGGSNTSNTDINQLLLQSPFGRLSEVVGEDNLSSIFSGIGGSGGSNPFAGGGMSGNSGGGDLPYGGNPFAGDNFNNIFGGGNASSGGSNPFAGGGMSGGSNPSAGSSGSGSNPFAGGGSGGSNPSAGGSGSGSNPFAGGGSGSGSNPFAGGGSGSNPFAGGGSGSNPFAGGGSGSGSNPFAGGGSGSGSNPFAGGDNNNPFTTGDAYKWDLDSVVEVPASASTTKGLLAGLPSSGSNDPLTGGGNLPSSGSSLPLPFGNDNWPFGEESLFAGRIQNASDNATIGNGNWHYGSDNATLGNGNWHFGDNNATLGNGNWHFGDNNATIGNGNWYVGSGNKVVGEGNQLSGDDNLVLGNPTGGMSGSFSGDGNIIVGTEDLSIVMSRNAISDETDELLSGGLSNFLKEGNTSSEQLSSGLKSLINQVGQGFINLIGEGWNSDQLLSSQGSSSTSYNSAAKNSFSTDEFLTTVTGIPANDITNANSAVVSQNPAQLW